MFYSQFILAKKGPLGTIWIAAHLERKLRKNQVADTDIGVSVDSILCPDVPIALRLSSHLLLGVVRIYNRKVNYLFDDCSEALLKVKQAFRSSAVDLPPEESKAPYNSITLPETFDLDDFEMPDNDIFQGNYVDHHVSSKEQITLQDTMEGVSYSTSKFGLNERFGDGDASVLDLDEELFLDEIDNARHPEERTDHQASGGSLSPLKQDDEHLEEGDANSETEANHVNEGTELMDSAQAPSTPGLLEEPNLSNVKEALACDDHLESDYHMESPMKENANAISYEDKEVLKIKEPEPKGESPTEANVEYVMKESSSVSGPVTDLLGQVKSMNTASEMVNNNIINASDTSCQESFQNVSSNENNIELIPTKVTCNDHHGLNEIASEKSFEGVVAKSSSPDASKISPKKQDGFFVENPENQACIETTDSMALNDAHGKEKEVSGGVPFLRPCSSRMESQSDVTKSGCNITIDADIQSEIADVASSGREAAGNLGNSEENLKENQVQDLVSGEACRPTSIELDVQVDSKNSQDDLVKNLSNNSSEAELPAPEKLLSVPEAHLDLQQDIPAVDYSTRNLEGLDAGNTGSKTVAGNKRSFTESTLTEQSLNSAESSRLVRFKRTTESIPDDEDLLSSILAGRRSSILKVKPTPRLSEATSTKRTRSAPRSVAPKRKVLMDDTMVLHGDTIRQQLTNTEDIRRVRKKAPCTRPEISLIQNQHLEDEIFLKSVFTGISVELASLHNKVYDLNRIVICANNLTGTSLKITADLSLPSQGDRNGALLVTVSEPNLAFHFDIAGFSIGSDMNHAIETDEVPDKTDVMEQNGTEILFARDEEIAEPCEDLLLSQNRHEEVDCEGTEVISSQDQVEPRNEAETSQLNPDAVNTVDAVNEIQLLSLTELSTDDKGDASAAIVETVELNETVETNSDVNMDVTAVFPSPKDVTSEELHSVDLNAIGRDEIQEKNDVYGEGETEAGVGDAKHGESEYNVSNDFYNATFEEQHEQVSVLEDGYMNNNGGIADHLEAYQPNLMDADISSFDPYERDELNYSAAGNDTEFLNVDDDDLTEMADDCEPDVEEARLTENSGWSSRTRAVSKYLQTAFIKETECGRKSTLSLDNLLIGKSRKEASRMFFETLVLKTRDYIHVDQLIPFDTITLKPRVKLIKSDF